MDYKKMAAAFAAGGAVLAAGAAYTMKQKNQKQPGVHFSSGGGRHVYLQDSSLSSLAVAAYRSEIITLTGRTFTYSMENSFLAAAVPMG